MKILFATACLVATVAATLPSVAAQTQTTWSDGYHENINQIQMTNTPLADAINLVADLGRVSIYVDRDTIREAGMSLQTPVTATLRNSTVGQILKEILPVGLAVAKQETFLVISTKERIDTGASFQLESKPVETADPPGIVDIGQMAADEAFSRTMPVHFQQMPLETAVQMLAGMAGKHAQFDRQSRHNRYRMVTLHRDHSTIRENLDDLLQAAGLTWEVSGHTVIIEQN